MCVLRSRLILREDARAAAGKQGSFHQQMNRILAERLAHSRFSGVVLPASDKTVAVLDVVRVFLGELVIRDGGERPTPKDGSFFDRQAEFL